MLVRTVNGTPLMLEEPPLASGGEGSVYKIQGYPGKLVKVYKNASDANMRSSKIRTMVNMCTNSQFARSGILNCVSWPLSEIYDDHNQFIGFGMNKIGNGMVLDDVYAYPPTVNYSIRDKVGILISMCDAITKLHDAGSVFGDFNPENIVIILENGVLKAGFIDADSYHINTSGKTFKCVVCAEGYIAPEIIRNTKGSTFENYAGPTFTKESDYFGLAVHCFCMLMNGCHPFKCAKHKTKQGSSAVIKPIDLRVERCETPFFKSVSNVQTPDWAPRTDDLPDYLVRMFRKAFVDGNSNPLLRPSEREWRAALNRYLADLVDCNNDKNHQYYYGMKKCPYCEAMGRSNLPIPIQHISGNAPKPNNNPAPSVSKNNTAITNTKPNYSYNKNLYGNAINYKKTISYAVLWIVTMLFAIPYYATIAYYIIVNGMPEQEWYYQLLVIVGAISGVIGICIYNTKLSRPARGMLVNAGDYFLSFLFSIVCLLIGSLAAFIVGIVIYILWIVLKYAIMIIIAIAILIGLFSG